MFSTLRKRLHVSPTTVIAAFALVFAMTGGAYAAKKYLITSTKQISPSVLKQLSGKAGPAGLNGAAGAVGAQGPQGPAGPAGSAGAKGENGKDGAKGTDGAPGESVTVAAASNAECPAGGTKFSNKTGTGEACNGENSASSFASTLPSEKTETGAWRFVSNGSELQSTVISFPIPLTPAAANAIAVETIVTTISPTGNCPGSSVEPKAEPGYLCLYTAAYESSMPSVGPFVEKLAAKEEAGVSVSGALLVFENAANHETTGGSFAITAP